MAVDWVILIREANYHHYVKCKGCVFMAKTLDPTLAANILDKWISFYGMEDADAWPREDYGYVKRAAKAMRLAIEILRGGTVRDNKEVKKAVQVLREWPTVHNMDDPQSWEEVSFPFVKNALESVLYAATYLEEKLKGVV